MWRLAGKPRARDVVLHNVMQLASTSKYPGVEGPCGRSRGRICATCSRNGAGNSVNTRLRKSLGTREGKVVSAPGSLAKRRPNRSPLRLTAMMTSAPRARQTETGTGLDSPPSTSHLPPIPAGLKIPGSEIEARTAS